MWAVQKIHHYYNFNVFFRKEDMLQNESLIAQ